MKIPEELIMDLVREEIGPDAVPLVEVIFQKENVSEFKIAEKLELSVNQARNILYRLNALNLAHSIRKKDKKKGWYIYYWTFNIPNAVNLIIELKQAGIRDSRRGIREIGKKREYVCNSCTIKYREETAMESQYVCSECGSVLNEMDEEKLRRDFDKKIKKFQIELNVALEIHKVLMLKDERLESRRKKAEDKKKAETRKAARKVVKKVVKKKVVKKTVRKVVKKPVKKKVVKKTAPKKIVKKIAPRKVVKKVSKPRPRIVKKTMSAPKVETAEVPKVLEVAKPVEEVKPINELEEFNNAEETSERKKGFLRRIFRK